MMSIIPEHRLTLLLTNDENGNDISKFINIISKCTKESKKAGFKNMFTANERELLEALASNLGVNNSEPANGFQQIQSTQIKVE